MILNLVSFLVVLLQPVYGQPVVNNKKSAFEFYCFDSRQIKKSIFYI